MTLDYHDQIRFGYVEPDDDGLDDLPHCPECGYEFTHTPTEAVQVDEDDWQLTWTCPTCQQDYSAEEVYP